MKFKFVKPALFIAIVISITATSCLKDSLLENGQVQAGSGGNINAIGFTLTATTTANFLTYSVDASPNDTTVALVPVTLSSTSAASQDIHVTVVQNDDLIPVYDTANMKDYVAPSSSIFTILNGGVVTIPKGSYTGYVMVKFIPNDMITANYAVGFTIKSIQESGYVISGNFNNGIVAIGVKNKYDGTWTLTQETDGWGIYGIADGPDEVYTWPSPVTLTTSGAGSVILSTTEGGSAQPAFTPDGGLTGFGATSTQYTFDPATDALVDVSNLAPDDGRGRAFHLNTDVSDSRYDPVSKTIYAAYVMTQIGRSPQFFYDTLVYVAPR